MEAGPCYASANSLRVVQRLLWGTISEHLNPAECEEVRRAIGGSLIDENDSIFQEASTLAEILGDLRIDTSRLLARQQLCSNPQKDTVETEIRILMEKLQRQAFMSPFQGSSARQRDPDAVIPKHNKREKMVYDYITTTAPAMHSQASSADPLGRPPTAPGVRTTSRPGTALSRPGTAASSSRCSRPSTANSSSGASVASSAQYTDASSIVASLQDKLNVYSIDTVKDTLRQALLEERSMLLEDVDYLHGLLDGEVDLQDKASAPPPSLQELKEYSTTLAHAVAEEESRVEHEARVGAMFDVAAAEPSKAGRLRGMVAASRGFPAGAPGSGTVLPAGTSECLVVHGDPDEAITLGSLSTNGMPAPAALLPHRPLHSCNSSTSAAGLPMPSLGHSRSASGQQSSIPAEAIPTGTSTQLPVLQRGLKPLEPLASLIGPSALSFSSSSSTSLNQGSAGFGSASPSSLARPSSAGLLRPSLLPVAASASGCGREGMTGSSTGLMVWTAPALGSAVANGSRSGCSSLPLAGGSMSALPPRPGSGAAGSSSVLDAPNSPGRLLRACPSLSTHGLNSRPGSSSSSSGMPLAQQPALPGTALPAPLRPASPAAVSQADASMGRIAITSVSGSSADMGLSSAGRSASFGGMGGGSGPPANRLRSVVEQLDADVNSMRGGVAAILAKHNHGSRPATPTAGDAQQSRIGVQR